MSTAVLERGYACVADSSEPVDAVAPQAKPGYKATGDPSFDDLQNACKPQRVGSDLSDLLE